MRLVEEVIRLIQEEKVNAEYAFHTCRRALCRGAGSPPNDEYLRERATDMRDLTARVLDNLLEVKDAFDLRHLTEPCIIVSHDLSPSTTAQLDKKFVLGFATDIGGKTSHTAIMARSLGIPAVVGLQTASQELETGDYALLDGYNGTVIVNPTDQTLFEYGQLAKIKASLEEKLREIQRAARRHPRRQAHPSLRQHRGPERHRSRAWPTARRAWACSARNFCSSTATACPARRSNTRSIARSPPRSSRIRSSSARSIWAATSSPRTCSSRSEMNPFLGWRAIRFCLAQPEFFRAQLRAILRASAEGNVKMMYPMISGLDELNQANALVEKCKAELRAENNPV